MSTDLAPERLRPVLQGLAGMSLAHQAEESFTPNSVLSKRCTSGSRIFRGGGWKEVLVIPFWETPAELAGFWFVGRQGGQGDRVFRRIDWRATAKPRAGAEAGLAGLPLLFQARLESYAHVVALEDPILLLRLQTRHARTSLTALPMVAWHADIRCHTRSAWQALGQRRPVFWAWELSPALLIQAMITDGLVSLCGPQRRDPKSISHYLRLQEPRDLLAMIIAAARPWREAARKWAKSCHPGAIEELVVKARTYGAYHELCRVLDVPIASVQYDAPAQTFVGGMRFLERNGCWLRVGDYRGSAAPIVYSSVIMRIDAQVRRGEDLLYRGRILTEGTEVAFEEPVEKLEQAPGTWLRKFCIKQGLPRPTIESGTPGRYLLDVAYAFSPPSAIVEYP